MLYKLPHDSGAVPTMTSTEVESPTRDWLQPWENVHEVVEPQIRADGLHVWPFNPAFPVEVRSFIFGRKRSIGLTHHNYFELLYVYSGRAAYQIQDREFVGSAGDLVVINGAYYHRLREVLEAPVRAVVLYFLPDVLRNGGATGEDVQYLTPFLLQDTTSSPVICAQTGVPGEILGLIGTLRPHLPALTAQSRLTARTILEMILVLLINHYKSRLAMADLLDRRQRAFDRMRPLFDYLDEHYAESIALSKATEIVSMSKAHFMRSFKRVTGQPFDTYVNHFRIAKAQALLASTDKSISEVGREVGFGDQSYFGLVFRRLTQLSPREYRKSLTLD